LNLEEADIHLNRRNSLHGSTHYETNMFAHNHKHSWIENRS